MASNYPGSLDSFDTIASDKKTSDAVGGRTHRQMHNDLGDAIESVQGELGTNPSGAYSTVKERLEALETPSMRSLNVSTIEFWGHSYLDAYPTPITDLTDGQFNIPATDNSVAGSDPVNADRWVPLLRTEIAAGTSFNPLPAVRVMMYGLNGIAADEDNMILTGMEHAFDFWVSRMRGAGEIFDDAGDTFDFYGDWAVLSVTDRNYGAGYHYTTSAAAYYTISTPSTFPGGVVAVAIMAQSAGSSIPASPSPGATHTAYIDGDQVASIVARSTIPGSENVFVLRIPDVPEGAVTITVQIDDITGLTAVDCWWWESPETTGPLVVLAAQPHLPTAGYDEFLPAVKGDEQVDLLNAIMAGMPAKFGPRVLYADNYLSTINGNSTYFKEDLVHPNEAGCHRIAAGIVDVIIRNGYALNYVAP